MNPRYMQNILVYARRLIFDSKNWSNLYCGSYNGNQCASWDVRANAWNSYGAIEKILLDHDSYTDEDMNAVVSALESHIDEKLFHYDYKHTHEEIMIMFDKTIEGIQDDLSMMSSHIPDDTYEANHNNYNIALDNDSASLSEGI